MEDASDPTDGVPATRRTILSNLDDIVEWVDTLLRIRQSHYLPLQSDWQRISGEILPLTSDLPCYQTLILLLPPDFPKRSHYINKLRQLDISIRELVANAIEEEKAVQEEVKSNLKMLPEFFEWANTKCKETAGAKLKAEAEKLKAEAEQLNAELLHENSALHRIRLMLHNHVIQLIGNIRVFVHVGPVIESDALLHTEGKSGNNGADSLSSRDRRVSSAELSSKPSDRRNYVGQFFFPPTTADRSSNGEKSNSLCSYSDLTKQTIVITEPDRD
jgi:hypothetical protein